MLYKTTSVAAFIMLDEHLQLLSSVNKLIHVVDKQGNHAIVLLEYFIAWQSLHSSYVIKAHVSSP